MCCHVHLCAVVLAIASFDNILKIAESKDDEHWQFATERYFCMKVSLVAIMFSKMYALHKPCSSTGSMHLIVLYLITKIYSIA